MKTDSPVPSQAPPKRRILRTALLSLPMLMLTLFFLTGGRLPSEPVRLAALAITYLFLNTLFILMIHTGKTDRYRAAFFIPYALLFSVSFITNMIETRGSISINKEEILECRTPFCHIVIPQTVIPLALSRTIVFPGTLTKFHASVASMLVIWLVASLALGRGWCSWACFFGGWDDGFSRLLRKARLKISDARWRLASFAVLLVVALWAAAALEPTYCAWLCPFKTVSEFESVISFKILVQTGIFLSLFAGLVVALPILSKRRVQCATFCPFGAFQSFTNKVNVFEVRVDPDRCKRCKLCFKACPTLSLDETVLEGKGVRMTCVKCGKCVDTCPRGALYFHAKGTPLDRTAQGGRVLFLYAAFLFAAIFAGDTMQSGILRILNLVTTGRFGG